MIYSFVAWLMSRVFRNSFTLFECDLRRRELKSAEDAYHDLLELHRGRDPIVIQGWVRPRGRAENRRAVATALWRHGYTA